MVDALSTVMGAQQVAQQQQQPAQPAIEQTAREIKTETEVPIEAPRAIEAAINDNLLRFRVTGEDQVEALIFNPGGELVKTIPPTDLQQLMKENNIPSIGKMFNGVA